MPVQPKQPRLNLRAKHFGLDRKHAVHWPRPLAGRVFWHRPQDVAPEFQKAYPTHTMALIAARAFVGSRALDYLLSPHFSNTVAAVNTSQVGNRHPFRSLSPCRPLSHPG